MSEIPKELKSISKLEKPYKSKCFFCSQIKLLNWQIRYITDSWSDICEDSYEELLFERKVGNRKIFQMSF